MASKRRLFPNGGYRLDGPGRFLHDVLQNPSSNALLKAVLSSRFPEANHSSGLTVPVTVVLRTRAEDEAVLVEWDDWVIGILSRKAAEAAKSAMRKQGNRTYLATEVPAEILVGSGDPQVWVDLPDSPQRD